MISFPIPHRKRRLCRSHRIWDPPSMPAATYSARLPRPNGTHAAPVRPRSGGHRSRANKPRTPSNVVDGRCRRTMARRAVIAIAQLTSTADVAANARRCDELIERAAQGRAEVRARHDDRVQPSGRRGRTLKAVPVHASAGLALAGGLLPGGVGLHRRGQGAEPPPGAAPERRVHDRHSRGRQTPRGVGRRRRPPGGASRRCT